jgi:putative methyltransferase (TIGR04325 family)
VTVKEANVWTGQYRNISDAQAASGGDQTTLFTIQSWLSRQWELWNSTSRAPQTLADLSLSRLTQLPLALTGMGSVRVADLGGGSGWTYLACLGAGVSLDAYTVIELEAAVEEFGCLSDGVLTHRTFDDVPGIPSPIDVLYCNSVLQYMPDNGTLLDAISVLKPAYVLLDELMWTYEANDWFTVQTNCDIPTVARFSAIEPLLDDLARHGLFPAWQRLVQGSVRHGFPDMSSFDATHRIPGYLSLLCR